MIAIGIFYILTYVISGILLYLIFGASYYKCNNERVKTPLFVIIILCLLYLVPVANVASTICWMVFRQAEDDEIYINSSLMKKY